MVWWLALLFGVARAEEQTCRAERCGRRVLRVFENGASEMKAEIEMSEAACQSRAAVDAAVSIAACENGAACEARDEFGRPATQCEERLYAVPRDRRFVFPTEYVGFERRLPSNATLRTLATSPRLFEIEGFLSQADALQLIEDALAIDDDEHRLMRSSTGPKGYNPSSVRTSENAWVKDTKTAMKLKRRAFEVLGYDRFDDQMADGLQVLRYNTSNAYVAHQDYLSTPRGVEKEAMDPSKGGANRLATVFLYLADVDEGGQTVFPLASRPRRPDLEALDATVEDVDLRDAVTPERSWQRSMVDDCYTKLAVRPKLARAILYYSQHPDGTLDLRAKHGGCPVLRGTKWAANLWVWNKPMPFGSSRFPSDKTSITAEFTYLGTRTDLSIYWEDRSKMGDITPTQPVRLNTYDGHRFTAKTSSGRPIASFQVSLSQTSYRFDDAGPLL
ncbi:hypothetical protein CTAYLR_005961 [Chrysophaeum taylorii]|uniref:Fe2OG dioxygenase domain-containing protein n=1 Tax=Chrysophaeum taylorii TaxID=2483200 RepID=A0AAD7XPD2_9STRA|nr:hypothetical protein CTAYLR_005961 [Chrysophaeum taylorii]